MLNSPTTSQIQNISPEEIIKTLFGLTPKQLEIFQFIKKIGFKGICISGLIREFKVDRSVIQKSLQILVKKQLIRRELVSLNEFNDYCKKNFQNDYEYETKTGALYLYFFESTEIIRESIIKRLMSWKGIIDQYI